MRPAHRRLVLGLMLLAAAAAAPAPVNAQSAPPDVVASLDLGTLEGGWFEVASTGSWLLRRCETDTRHTLERRTARALRVVTTCTAGGRAERRRGLIESGRSGDGRLAIRYAPILLAWVPASWADFWVLAKDDVDGWLLVGDRRRRSLAILSRDIAPAESAIAQATAAARGLGYDVGRLRRIAHPAGPGALAADR